ncbi:hypothetical protein F2Q69_00028596 [Brassica cretica]|uniref:Uncharacterized protein n=1 Tax=Brassica cretica TaxID=69181 RepID=A0A8S9S100_BRACR|nr:hypothetical protein F2Q69_00028596 [Brassica cretica]
MFAKGLIQGPTPYGFEIKDSSAQGGDSFLTEKTEDIESKASNEESRTKSSTDDVLFAREVRHKDDEFLAHILAAHENPDTKEEPKTDEENKERKGKRYWKKAEENVDIELKNEAERKVSKILEMVSSEIDLKETQRYLRSIPIIKMIYKVMQYLEMSFRIAVIP